ncbi:hypothetical protein [Novipirellula caenicola]|uniref:Secreted protein n=1 Tax=Novipirellula caenicola TaxID=1536901 RepID=A0ABP9VSU6_9BACT
MSLLRRVSLSHFSFFAQPKRGASLAVLRVGLLFLAVSGTLCLATGCGESRDGVVKESDEYSYDEIMAQAAEEELASEAEREP